jgi:hypothetical protein
MMVRFGEKPTALRQVIFRQPRMRRGNKKTNPWPMRLDVMAESNAVHVPRHPDIRKQHVHTGRLELEDCKRRLGMLRFQNQEACLAQTFCHSHADQQFVFGYDDYMHPNFLTITQRLTWGATDLLEVRVSINHSKERRVLTLLLKEAGLRLPRLCGVPIQAKE